MLLKLNTLRVHLKMVHHSSSTDCLHIYGKYDNSRLPKPHEFS